MDTSIRKPRISVRDAILKYPKQFSFEMAVYTLGYEAKIAYGTETSVKKSPVKTVSIVSYKLQATEIEKIKETDRAIIYTNRLALAGLNAPLPTPYAELAIQRFHERDYAISAFLNIFNSRLLSISYRINQRLYIALQTKDNVPLLKCMSKFFGIESVPKQMTRLAYLFWSRNRTVEGLRIVLEKYFNFDVKIEQMSEHWHERTDISLLGQNRLGKNAYLGHQAAIKAFCIKIHITHKDSNVIYRLLSDEHFLNDVKSLIRKYLGSLVTCKLEIKPLTAPPLRLHTGLGLNTWLQGATTDSRRVMA